MHKLKLLILFILTGGTAWAGIPQAMNFQGSAQRKDRTNISNTWIYLKVDITKDSTLKSVPFYSENDSALTDSFGSFRIQIGRGHTVTGNFGQIPWAAPFRIFISVQYDTNSFISPNYRPHPVGPIEMVTVPYAFAASAVSGIKLDSAKNGDFLSYDSAHKVWVPYTFKQKTYIAGKGIKISGDTISVQPPPAPVLSYAVFEDSAAIDSLPSQAGSSTANAQDYVRILNKTVSISGTDISRSGGTITLKPGTYFIDGYSMAWGTDGNVAYLYNTTDAIVAIMGSSGYSFIPSSSAASPTSTPSNFFGVLTVTGGTKTFVIRHYIDQSIPTSVSSNGYKQQLGAPAAKNGKPFGKGAYESYSRIFVQKLN